MTMGYFFLQERSDRCNNHICWSSGSNYHHRRGEGLTDELTRLNLKRKASSGDTGAL